MISYELYLLGLCFSVFVNFLRSIVTLLLLDVLLYSTLWKIKLVLGCWRQVVSVIIFFISVLSLALNLGTLVFCHFVKINILMLVYL